MIASWRLRDRTLTFDNGPLILGIVNVTPDSFSDGGTFLDPESAIRHGLRLLDDGADLLDVGGESTRPGAAPVELDEELRRVLPVIEGLVARSNGQAVISVDTYKAEVAKRALEAGAHVVNDVTAARADFDSPSDAVCESKLRVLLDHKAGVILMHSKGPPTTMQQNPRYKDVVADIGAFLAARCRALTARGMDATSLVIDPGVGFGMIQEDTLTLLRNLVRLQDLNRPVCLGVSRKGFLGQLLNRPRDQRMVGSVAVACHAMSQGAVQVLRVHDVGATRDAVTVFKALSNGTSQSALSFPKRSL